MSENGSGRLLPEQLPASVILRHVADPASGVKGAPPNFGQQILPHIYTVSGRYGVAARAYSQGDEALLHSKANAEIMRNEPMIMECLEARMRSTALLNWHVEPLDPDELDPEQRERIEDQQQARVKRNSESQELANKVGQIIRHTPNFLKLRYILLDALWYGRYATAQQFGSKPIAGRRAIYCKRWEPRHGDKLVFRYDDNTGQYDPDQVGIRVGPGYNTQKTFIDYAGHPRRKVETTQFGLAYWFDYNERKAMIVHKHIIEDGDFDHPVKAGNIHGVGIRSRIYWTWFAYSECLKLMLEYLERSALGIEIWRYPAHNPQAEERTRQAAMDRGSPGRSVLLVPVPEGEQADLYDTQIIEPGLGGLSELKSVLHEFFGHKIKRYVMGQILTSEAEATGLGSGVADAHVATLADIIKFDATNLEESITTDLVAPIQHWNFPGSEQHYLRFVVNTESPDSQRIMDGYQAAYEMGLKLKAEDIYSVIGASKPEDGDDVVEKPDPAEMGMGGMGGGNSLFGPFSGNPLSQDGGDQGGELDAQGYSVQSQLRDVKVQQPTDAQLKAGNYKKGHVRWNGLDITIENPKGSIRRGKNWEQKMAHHYGYIRRTEGRDGDHVDCFIGNQPHSEIVFIVDQQTPAGRFDEHKCIIGATNRKQAKNIYLANYPPGWKCGPITSMTVDQFKAWLAEGDTTKRVERQVSQYSADDFDRFIDRYGKWEEHKHPRDKEGRFTEKGGSASRQADLRNPEEFKKLLGKLSNKTQQEIKDLEWEDSDIRQFIGDVLSLRLDEHDLSKDTKEELEAAIWEEAVPARLAETANFGSGRTLQLYRAVNHDESKFEDTFWAFEPEHSRPYASVHHHFGSANMRQLNASFNPEQVANESNLEEAGEAVGVSGYYVYDLADDPDVRDELRRRGFKAVEFDDIGPENQYDHPTLLILHEPERE